MFVGKDTPMGEEKSIGQKMFEACMRKIIAHTTITFLQRKKTEQILREAMLDVNDVADTIPAPEIIPDFEKYAKVYACKDFVFPFEDETVGRVFLKLKKEYRVILGLYFCLGFSFGELGEHLGENEDNVKRRYYRAKKKLKKLLENAGYER